MLSDKGEELAKKIAHLEELSQVEVIYSSCSFSAVATSKYLAQKNALDIFLDPRLQERVIGQLDSNDYEYLEGMQEHDFTFKLNHGESLEEVKLRMATCIKEILQSDYTTIFIATHSVAMFSLFLAWCSKDFNLEDRLILDYHDQVIFDGTKSDCDFIKVVFDGKKVVSIERY